MGYIPKFIYFDHPILISYPFGSYWNDSYIKQVAKALYDTYKEEISCGACITFVVRGTSGAMLAGAMLNELHNINSSIEISIAIVRKPNEDAHSESFMGIERYQGTRIIVVDEFIQTGDTINAILNELDSFYGKLFPKYDMLCISNHINARMLKKNHDNDYKKWKNICSRFRHVLCCPKRLI